jgi:hypothetical protein
MKTLYTVVLFIVTQHLIAQLTVFDTTLRTEMTNTDFRQNKIATNKGFGIYMTRQIAKYLSSSDDINLSKNYFLANFGDNRFVIGKNIKTFADQNGTVRQIIEGNLSIESKEKLTDIYKNSKWNETLGIGLKYTYMIKQWISFGTPINDGRADYTLINGKLAFPTSYQIRMAREREITYQSLRAELTNKLATVSNSSYSALYATASARDSIQSVTIETEQKLTKSAIQAFYEQEAKALENPNAKTNTSFLFVSVKTQQTLMKNNYTVLAPLDTGVQMRKMRPWNIDLSLNFVLLQKQLNHFIQLGYTLEETNTIVEGFISGNNYADVLDITTTLLNTNGSADTLRYVTISDKDATIYRTNAYQNWTAQIIRLHYVLYPCKSIGVSVKGNYSHSPENKNLTLAFGVPLSLKTKEEKPVNIEPFIRRSDVANSSSLIDGLIAEKLLSKKDLWYVGINLSIPFGSSIY